MPTITAVAKQMKITTTELKQRLGKPITTPNSTEISQDEVTRSRMMAAGNRGVDDILMKAAQEINQLIITSPHALTLQLVNEDKGHRYTWRDKSATSEEIRLQAREILLVLWQSGAYNYQQIADVLRITVQDVIGLMDEQFREKNRLA